MELQLPFGFELLRTHSTGHKLWLTPRLNAERFVMLIDEFRFEKFPTPSALLALVILELFNLLLINR